MVILLQNKFTHISFKTKTIYSITVQVDNLLFLNHNVLIIYIFKTILIIYLDLQIGRLKTKDSPTLFLNQYSLWATTKLRD